MNTHKIIISVAVVFIAILVSLAIPKKYLPTTRMTIIIVIIFIVGVVQTNKEDFQNKYTLETPGILPGSNNPGILDNVFPETGFTSLQNIGASQIWKDYPIYQVGSYSQTTNNIRYPDNPDEGTCMPADFCNLYYKNREKVSNIVMPLEPVKENESAARVNYYNSSVCGKFA